MKIEKEASCKISQISHTSTNGIFDADILQFTGNNFTKQPGWWIGKALKIPMDYMLIVDIQENKWNLV